MPIDLLSFVRKWNASLLPERSAAPQHFRDLCEVLGVPHPTQADEIGASYTFEKRVRKVGSEDVGYADVWKRGWFAWEYKSKGADLNKAYRQLNEYHEALENPPLLVVCDFVNFEVHTKFENLPSRVYKFTLDDLLEPRDTATSALPPLEVLRNTFGDYNQLRPGVAAERVTKAAASDFLRLAQRIELEKAITPQPSREQIAHFLMRLVFCLFADSVGLLPNHTFRRLVENDRHSPISFNRKLPDLFKAMSFEHGYFGVENIPHFNGGLFSDNSTIPLDHADLGILHSATQHDWSHVEPAIFGTLFERSLDAAKRSMIGAHYTSADDILLLIEPVMVTPLERRWEAVRESVLGALRDEDDGEADSSASGPAAQDRTLRNDKRSDSDRGTRERVPFRGRGQARLGMNRPALTLLQNWAAELSSIRVLDPACGSGNFLYLALKRLLDLWHQARVFGIAHGLTLALDPIPHPGQLFGIETDFYAHEIASVVVWIGFLQWKHDHGVKDEKEPLLQKLTNIEHADAILRYRAAESEDSSTPPGEKGLDDAPGMSSGAEAPSVSEASHGTAKAVPLSKTKYEDSGHPLRGVQNDEMKSGVCGEAYEPDWPAADFIIGNPPFLGDKKMRAELGDEYVDDLRALYEGRVPGGADLVTFWFEKSRAQIEAGDASRAGLIATNSISMVGNRPVLERIKQTGDIFMAWSDNPWILAGAAVRIAIVGFDNGTEPEHVLDGHPVKTIHADLTSGADVTGASRLAENDGLCFLGMMKAGPFDIDEETARKMLSRPPNPNGRPNSDVVKRRLGGQDISGRDRGGWIIDFGVSLTEEAAALYEWPFEYVKKHVKPLRDQNNRARTKARWWIHGEARPGLRKAIANFSRCIVTPEVNKHRLFVWMDTQTIPDHTCHVVARDDDYFFGILQSSPHEFWSLSQGAWIGKGNDPRYSSARTFDTFPFPWPPGTEPSENADPRVRAIADAARELVRLRDEWLNPPGADEDELKKRTLTKLYNQRPEWLAIAHRALDEAVFAAYGWPSTLTRDEILSRLLELNRERAAAQAKV